MKYNPQGVIDIPEKTSVYKSHGLREGRKDKVRSTTKANFPRSILEFANENNSYHPTQKPAALCEYLIKTYTNEQEIVLDNCMGSGTTGVACLNTNRRFIGIEKEEKYFQIATDRIQQSIKDS
jgi:site-specific DNA-methyltransferase (adenine-specific)